MAKFFGKKQVLLGTLVVALGVAVYLNYSLAQQPSVQTPKETAATTQTTRSDKTLGEALHVNGEVTQEDYFESARRNRESARKEASDLIKDVLNNVKVTAEEKEKATAQVLANAKAIEQEQKIEEILKAQGFKNCVVYIADDNCHVVVQKESLTVADTAKIANVVGAQSDIPTQNIQILSVK